MLKEKIITPPDHGKWELLKDRLKQKYLGLTDQDLHFEAGKMDKMFENVQVKLGKSKEEMHKIIVSISQIF